MKGGILVVAALALLVVGVGRAEGDIVSFSQLNLGLITQPVNTVQNLQDNAIGNSLATITHDGISLPGPGQGMGPPSAVATATAMQSGSQGSVVFNNDLLGVSPGGFTINTAAAFENFATAFGNFKFTFKGK